MVDSENDWIKFLHIRKRDISASGKISQRILTSILRGIRQLTRRDEDMELIGQVVRVQCSHSNTVYTKIG